MIQTDFTLHRRAHESIAQGYLTNSKRPESLVMGVYPTHLKRGYGCHVWDHSGKKYIDFITGLGTNIIGYANERVNLAMGAQMTQGASLSFGTELEIEVAEKVKEVMPFVDCVKFLKTGTEACMAAVKIARAATGKSLVLSEGYHGWSDGFVSLTPPATGCVSGQMLPLKNARQLIKEAAAVIIEPVITDISRERIDWLYALKDECKKYGALLIFDEVITGFRFPKFSVASFFGIEPDLIILGKAIANGMPLAAVGGKYGVMNKDEYFISSTYAGETISLAAAKTTMSLLQTKYNLSDLWEAGQKFINEFNIQWPSMLQIEGYPTRGVFKGDAFTKALFFQEACNAGLLFGPSFFFNFPLAEEAKTAMGTIKDIFLRLKTGAVALRGEPPKSPFAQRVRESQ
jgi:glutamate-1-semialdehyde 2,1-aminomutase